MLTEDFRESIVLVESNKEKPYGSEGTTFHIRIPYEGSSWQNKTTVKLVKQMFETGLVYALRTDESEQRKGLAYKVMRTLEIVAKDQGIKFLVSYVANDNEASIKLHQKLGFSKVAEAKIGIDRGNCSAGMWVKTIEYPPIKTENSTSHRYEDTDEQGCHWRWRKNMESQARGS